MYGFFPNSVPKSSLADPYPGNYGVVLDAGSSVSIATLVPVSKLIAIRGPERTYIDG